MYNSPHPSTSLSATHSTSPHVAAVSSASNSISFSGNISTTMQSSPRSIAAYSPFAPGSRGERRNYLASTTYPTSVPRRAQVSPGVWSDGNDHVLSSAYPPVQLLLKEARSTLKQPVIPNDIVFTLAALEVFYKPSDPAHWIFWSDEKKEQTAEVVTRIALHQPPLIRSPVAWNGASEYLPILANHHGATYRHYYESQDWYKKIVPPKSSAASKVLNLRKRKPNPGAFREPSKSPGLEEDEIMEEPPRKKVKGPTRTSPVVPSDSSRASSVSPQETPTLHSHNRSISHASSQTAVASQTSRRSASVISALTVGGSDKGKQSSDDAEKDTESQSDNEEGMVTRGRASRSRVVEVSKDIDGDRVKSGKQTVNGARNGAQRTKRKL